MFLVACAGTREPRPETGGEPPATRGAHEEILSRARFRNLKISGVISLALEDRPVLDRASAVLYVSPPDRVRLRVYRMGIPVLDLLYRDGKIWSRPEADASAYRALVYGLFPTLFWWRDMEAAEVHPLRDSLMLRTSSQRVWLDRENLLPLVHEFISPSGPVYVQYSAPMASEGGRLFSSHIAVAASSYSGLITIRKMAVDEELRPELFLWTSD